jgi:Tol biopolymer transport system component
MRPLRLPATAVASFIVLAVAGVTGVAYAAITVVSGNSNGANALAQTIRTGNLQVTGSFLMVPKPQPGPNGTADEPLGGFPTEGSTFAILTNGSAAMADDPNNSTNSGISLGGGSRTGNGSDGDVTILKIAFTAPPGANCVGFDFKFLSEEYPEFVGQASNDAFIAELDQSTWSSPGSQIIAPNNFAFDPAGKPISVNATGPASVSPANATGTTYDAATAILHASKQLTPGPHSLFLSIFDQGSRVFDSAVFVDNLVVGSVPNPSAQCVEGAGQPASATISLASDQSTVIAGAQTVPIDGIDLADLRRTSPGTQAAPLDAVPLDAVPLDAVPLDAVSLGDLGLSAALLNEVFGGIHLSEIPLSTLGGWPAKLAGTPLAGVPLNTITLADVYELNEGTTPDAVPLDAVPLDAVDLSGTPLDAVGLGAVALGALPLDAVPLDAVGTNSPTENAQDWCDLLNPPDPDIAGYSCPPIDPSTETVIGAAIKGVPLDAVPLDAVPLDAVSPGQFPLDAVPLDAVPLDAVTLAGSPLDAVPLDAVDFTVSTLRTLPLDAVGPGIVNCSAPYVCAGKTLGQAVADGRLIPGATLGQLVEALKAVAGDSGASVADLIFGLPGPPQFTPELTFGDLFALLLGGEGVYDWSQLDLNAFPINEHSPDGGVITYRATFEVTGGIANPTATIHAALPNGGRYKAGSTQLRSGGSTLPVGEPQVGAAQLSWSAGVQRGVPYELIWQVHAPIELGNYSIVANVSVPGLGSPAFSGPVSVGVTQTLEPNDALGVGALLEGEKLYLGYMLQGDVDRHRITIPPAFGSRVNITLSHIAEGTDLDLTVAGPPSPTLRNAPSNSIPLQNTQLPDTELALDERGQALPPELLQDVPTDLIAGGNRVIRATSDNRGNADEEVSLLSQGETGEYIVQVSDYEGDSRIPYMLEVEVEGPPNLGPCQARTFPFAGQGVAGTMPSIPPNVNTLILVNRKRLGDTYGAAAATSVMNSLAQLAGRADLGIVGAVLPVESNAAVASAYTAWDGNPCSPVAANNVVSAIGQLIDSVEPDNLQYKVIVGGDDQIPFGRVADETLFANEEDYTASLPGANNQYKSAFGHGLLLTDDVWAEEGAPQFLGHELFVPDQAVGRLVETPGEITGMITAFMTSGGAVTREHTLTTGYDFLTDGANAVNAPFNAALGPANARTLINETWAARDAVADDLPDDLEDMLFPPGSSPPPQFNSINAHFDHTRLLPAAENLANRADNLYLSQDIRNRGASAVAKRILFSMGCHSGLPTSDAIYGATDPLAKDWAQTFLAGGAFAWVGNTGYGLGDTVEVAYTERLHAHFSGNLDGSLTLGEAFAQAKQEYLAQLGVIAGYDAKVLMEATLYGLPMLKVGSGAPPASPPALPIQTDPATGLEAAPFNVSPSFTLVTTPSGKFYRAQTTQTTNRRPIEPAVSFDVTQPGKVAHGIMITSLQSPPDEVNFDAAFSRVVTDKSEDEPEVVGEASFPAKIQSLSTFSSFSSPNVTRQNAVLIAGLFQSDGVPDPFGIGTQVRYSQIAGHVLYTNPGVTDFAPPELGPLQSQTIGGGVAFAVDVTDAAGTVEDVKVIYRDCSGIWRLSTLQPSGGNRWSGGGAIAPPGCDQIDYYLQAADDAGNVAVSSKKVQIEPLVLPPPTGETAITITPAGAIHPSGWFTNTVSVTISPSTGVEYSVDGGPFQPYTGQFTVAGDGVHLVEARAPDGSTKTVAIAIDTVAPVVLMTTPPEGAVYELGQVVKAEFTCADAGSGPATCSGTPANGAPLDTSSAGTKTITVTATDLVGHTTTFTRTYEVVQRDVLFVRVGDIWVVDPAGGAPVQLTSGLNNDDEPEWYPGGKKIVFSRTTPASVDLYSMSDDGTNIDQLTSHPAVDRSPSVSPDGTKIAFSSNREAPQNFDIYVLDIATGNVTRLTTDAAADTLPAWSPDGTQIVFSSLRTGNGDIYKLNVANPATTQVRLTSGPTANGVDTEPAWHGSTIAFATNRHGPPNYEIYTMNTSGGQQTRRTNNATPDVTPSWRGDGSKLAFASNRSSVPADFDIWTMNADGSAQAPLVSGPPTETNPDW